MNFEELLEEYQALLVENSSLKEEIENLNMRLGVPKQRAVSVKNSDIAPVNSSYPPTHASSELFNLFINNEAQQINSLWAGWYQYFTFRVFGGVSSLETTLSVTIEKLKCLKILQLKLDKFFKRNKQLAEFLKV